MRELGMSYTELERIPLEQCFFFLDRIQADQARDHEKEISKYLTLLSIATAPHSKKGGKEVSDQLRGIMYMFRELDDTPVQPDSDAVDKMSKLFKKSR